MKKHFLAAILSVMLACVSSVPAMASTDTVISPVRTETNETTTQDQNADSLMTADAAGEESGRGDEEKDSLTASEAEESQTVSGAESDASETGSSAEQASVTPAPGEEAAANQAESENAASLSETVEEGTSPSDAELEAAAQTLIDTLEDEELETVLEAINDVSSEETGGESSEETGGESSEETGGESSEETSGDSSEETGGESSEETSGDSSEETGGESSEETGGESSEETGGESSEETGGESSEETGGESSEETGGESSEEPEEDDEEAEYISLEGAEIGGLLDRYMATGKKIMPTIYVELDGLMLTEGVEYLVLYGRNTDVGKGRVLVIGINFYTGCVGAEFDILESVKVSAAAQGERVKLSWKAGQDCTHYSIYRAEEDGAYVSLGSTEKTVFYDAATVSGHSYSYKIDGGSCLGEAGPFVFLSAPRLSSVTINNSGAKVAWKSVAGATKYRVLVRNGSKWTKVADTKSTVLTDKTADEGNTYTYTVQAIAPNKSDYNSQGISTTYYARPVIKTWGTNDKANYLTWESVKGASKYLVYRKEGSGDWKCLAKVKALKYNDKTAKAGHAYRYYIRCANSKGWAASYASSTVKIIHITTPVLKRAVFTGSKVNLNWKKSPGVTKYRIYRKTGNGKYVKIADTSELSYKDKKIKFGKTYTYAVRAIKPTLSQYKSNAIKVKT